MATIVLSAAGMALGSSIGGTFLGLSAATIGRAAGAAIGRRIDERILGNGAAAVETGKVDRFRLMGASEGTPLADVYGRMRVPGQVIWASRFEESSETTGGGKGGSPEPRTTTYSYTVSMAVALCKGEITHVGRVWADGVEVAPQELNMRVYHGNEDQQPDPKMEAVEGAGLVPSYRGIAYVVLEDMPLGRFGNRIPQLSFEVFRPAAQTEPEDAEDLAHLIQGVALIPGTGEYALATSPVYLSHEYGEQTAINLNTPSGQTDFSTALGMLNGELPQCQSVSLVVSWFGDDLRCGSCQIKPKVEQKDTDSAEMPWRVCGVGRQDAEMVAEVEGRPVYGGTPADQSVIEAIVALRAAGQEVVYYPFILMEQLSDNTLPDPYSGNVGQAVLPWRGRITSSLAPDQPGTPDQTAQAEAEVASFFGTASVSDFAVSDGTITYAGPAEWSFRRYILHQAFLCQAAGGVDAFCIGSEMRGLTQIRGSNGRFPAVAALKALAADVRSVLGPACKIGYAADWSEYHGYQPAGTADKLFHLDPLWADANIDFIGIDNYMPLSDWRDGEGHVDAEAGSIYDLDYLTGNVAGGEGFDWFYHSDEARDAQIRTPITDGDGEPWVWRYKDLKGWWQNPHHERINGQRQADPTDWVPESKPIWFTELGCAAIDKGTNQPNKFLDPKSSESTLPHYSSGVRDDYIQMQYLRAMHRHFASATHNPTSPVYGGAMVDMARAHVWAWDARPFPWFPALDTVWSDGGNYRRGHWLNGRSTSRSLASVVRELCAQMGVTEIDTTRLHGVVRGLRVDDTDTVRGTLQTLMMAHGFDASEREGVLVFKTRTGLPTAQIDPDSLVWADAETSAIDVTRASAPEVSGRVQVAYVEAEGAYDVRAAEAAFSDDRQHSVHGSELPLSLTGAEGTRVAERWLAEARLARETARFSLPPSLIDMGPGDVVSFAGNAGLYRIDRCEIGVDQAIEATRVDPEVYRPHEAANEPPRSTVFVPPVPLEGLFLDLPLLTGDEVPHAPYLAVSSRPWPGDAALYSAAQDNGYSLNTLISRPSIIGVTQTPLDAAQPGLWDRGAPLRVRLVQGQLSSAELDGVLAGSNVAAIGGGSGSDWEVFQFAKADLVAPRTYDISLRLRGQAGTDGIAGGVWPSGARFVLVDGRPQQIEMASGLRGVDRHYRLGVANRPYGDPAYRHEVLRFAGVGLRPYSVCHLRQSALANGDMAFSWIRRTRADGDSWDQPEVPLNEAKELYSVRLRMAGEVVREAAVLSPSWVYSAAMAAEDGPGMRYVEVAQVSDHYGPGLYRGMAVNGPS